MVWILTVMCDSVTGLPTLAGDHRVQAPSVDPELDTWQHSAAVHTTGYTGRGTTSLHISIAFAYSFHSSHFGCLDKMSCNATAVKC